MAETLIKPSLSNNKLLLFLINDILDYSQIESKNFYLKYEYFALKDLIEECI
jgi:hypothetical protein